MRSLIGVCRELIPLVNFPIHHFPRCLRISCKNRRCGSFCASGRFCMEAGWPLQPPRFLSISRTLTLGDVPEVNLAGGFRGGGGADPFADGSLDG
jgi:hypothetical protein